MTRAVAILIADQKIALIERCRNQKHYYVFPGGTVEAGESVIEAVIRETREELGLWVTVEKLVAKVLFNGTWQYYFLVHQKGGVFGSGQGPEMNYRPESPSGSFTPVWVAVDDLLELPVYPRDIAALVQQATQNGWPAEPLLIIEPPRQP